MIDDFELVQWGIWARSESFGPSKLGTGTSEQGSLISDERAEMIDRAVAKMISNHFFYRKIIKYRYQRKHENFETGTIEIPSLALCAANHHMSTSDFESTLSAAIAKVYAFMDDI